MAKWVRMSPRKARLVAQHIRGRSVPEARTVLAFTQRAAAREIEKVLRSAVANAEANHGLNGDDLVVSAAYVDEGPVMKRWRARARGRVARIKKPTCHITIKLVPASDTSVSLSREATVPPLEAPPVSEPAVAEAVETEPEVAEGVETEPEAEAQTAEGPQPETKTEAAEESEPPREPELKAEAAEEPENTPSDKTEETEG